MHYRNLGQTGIQVSVIGLGTTKLGRNQGVKYPTAFDLPSDDSVIELLTVAKDLGVNLLDTAPAYGSSEERLGKALKGQRQDWIIGTKVGEDFDDRQSSFNFTAEHFELSIKRSLQRFNTDYLDIVLVHSNGDDMRLIKEDGVLEILNHFKQQGLIRATGMSTKTVDGGIAALAQADCVMMTYHPEYLDEVPVLDFAKEHSKGVLIKKTLASGHAVVDAKSLTLQQRFEFILEQPAVSSMVVGTINPNHLQQNVAALG